MLLAVDSIMCMGSQLVNSTEQSRLNYASYVGCGPMDLDKQYVVY